MISEIAAIPDGLIRIPPELDVPVSQRVRRLIDTAPMRRLAEISQLGLVHLVYPGARHSRLEHSLGVYRNSLQLLRTLEAQNRFRALVDPSMAEAFVLASLFHDVGHWPFCHAIEDMRLANVPRHESRVASILADREIGTLLAEDWSVSAADVQSILSGKKLSGSRLDQQGIELLASALSGPVDVDKLDYLVRDSLHAGVPYGRNFDAGRLIGAVVVHPDKPRIAITDKGRTAAEMMVFSRYVMFSEVYWHHAVRSATAMLQRLVAELQPQVNLIESFDDSEADWVNRIRAQATSTPVAQLAEGLFGAKRRLYKRVAEFTVLERRDLHRELAHRPYWWLVACGSHLASALSSKLRQPLGEVDLLLDAPPVKLEVDINMDVVCRDGRVRKLGDVSPVAESLAYQQFDGHVKRVRVFVAPERREEVRRLLQDDSFFLDAIAAVNNEVA